MNGQKTFLVSLILVLGAISFLMIRPLLGYVIGAAILAFVLKPAHEQLSRLINNRIAAFLVVLFGIALIVLPFAYSILIVFEDAQDIDASFDEASLIDLEGIEQWVEQTSGQEVDLRENLRASVDQFVSTTLGSFSELVNLLTGLAIGLSLMLFLMYYFLTDGGKLVSWLQSVTPLPSDIQEQLYTEIETTTWAVIKGHVLVAVVQGLLAGIGLALTGVPNFAFWTFVMVILAFIPIIGTFMVWGPASIYLFLVNEPVMGALLALYGLTVVALSDNFLRPFAVDRGTNLHPATILIGVIGGVYLFSAAGLFIGPIILGVFKSVLLVFKNNYEDL